MPEKFVDPEESTCGTHMAAEVLLGSSAMGGYCLIPQCQNKPDRLSCLFVKCVPVLLFVIATHLPVSPG